MITRKTALKFIIFCSLILWPTPVFAQATYSYNEPDGTNESNLPSSFSEAAAVGNLDGQPDLEVVIVANFRLHVLKPNPETKSFDLLWDFPFPPLDQFLLNADTTPSIADLDQDGQQEIIVGLLNNLFVLTPPADENATQLVPKWPVFVSENTFHRFHNLTIADLDGNGQLEVVSARGLSIVVVENGQLKWEFQTGNSDNVSGSTLADVDLDGLPEVVILSNSRVISVVEEFVHPVFEKMGVEIMRLDMDDAIPAAHLLNTSLAHHIVVADIVNDKRPEILVVMEIRGQGQMAVFEINETLDGINPSALHFVNFFTAPNFLATPPVGTPAVGELDGDPATAEVAIAVGDTLHVIEEFDRINVATSRSITIPPKNLSIRHTFNDHSPSLVDVNGDRIHDIVIGDEFGRVFVIDGENMEILNTFQEERNFLIVNDDLQVADIDGNGTLEVLAGYVEKEDSFNGRVFVDSYRWNAFSLDGSSVDPLSTPWPTQFQDNRRDSDARGLFIRGNTNGNHEVNDEDAVALLKHLFLGEPGPVCPDAADANDDGILDIADPIAILMSHFIPNVVLPEPTDFPGVDPTLDDLICY